MNQASWLEHRYPLYKVSESDKLSHIVSMLPLQYRDQDKALINICASSVVTKLTDQNSLSRNLPH